MILGRAAHFHGAHDVVEHFAGRASFVAQHVRHHADPIF
jgi:hypothetical protein